MKKIILTLIVLSISTFCMADKSIDKLPEELNGQSISMGPGGVCVDGFGSFTWDEWNKFIGEKTFDKSESKLYRCASNDLVYSEAYSYDYRLNTAKDLANTRISEIGVITKCISGEIKVYFEICGNGFTVSEKKQIEKEIQEAIQKILDSHFDR